MDGFDARHVVGWSIFGLSILALAGGVAINRVMVAGIEATKVRQTKTAQAISNVHRRTRQWPRSEQDPLLNDSDRSLMHEANATFRLDQVDAPAHRAFYIVRFGDHPFRLSVNEKW